MGYMSLVFFCRHIYLCRASIYRGCLFAFDSAITCLSQKHTLVDMDYIAIANELHGAAGFQLMD